MIIRGELLKELGIITPFCEKTVENGLTYGVNAVGYDIRLAEDLRSNEKNNFSLASSMEHFTMPDNIVAFVHDKSTLARMGLSVQNTVIEPGWVGYLTLEIAFHREQLRWLSKGSPIAQVIFHRLDKPVNPYSGKYQNAPEGVSSAIFE
jgi:dCTP deaminase